MWNRQWEQGNPREGTDLKETKEVESRGLGPKRIKDVRGREKAPVQPEQQVTPMPDAKGMTGRRNRGRCM